MLFILRIVACQCDAFCVLGIRGATFTNGKCSKQILRIVNKYQSSSKKQEWSRRIVLIIYFHYFVPNQQIVRVHHTIRRLSGNPLAKFALDLKSWEKVMNL